MATMFLSSLQQEKIEKVKKRGGEGLYLEA